METDTLRISIDPANDVVTLWETARHVTAGRETQCATVLAHHVQRVVALAVETGLKEFVCTVRVAIGDRIVARVSAWLAPGDAYDPQRESLVIDRTDATEATLRRVLYFRRLGEKTAWEDFREQTGSLGDVAGAIQ